MNISGQINRQNSITQIMLNDVNSNNNEKIPSLAIMSMQWQRWQQLPMIIWHDMHSILLCFVIWCITRSHSRLSIFGSRTVLFSFFLIHSTKTFWQRTKNYLNFPFADCIRMSTSIWCHSMNLKLFGCFLFSFCFIQWMIQRSLYCADKTRARTISNNFRLNFRWWNRNKNHF